MKIVLIVSLFGPSLGGGAGQMVSTLASGLARRGDTVTVITSGPNHRPTVENNDGIKIIRFFPRNLYWVHDKDKQPMYRKIAWQLIDTWNPLVFQPVRELLEAEQPDIVHVHNLRGFSPAVWSAAKTSGATVLGHSCHDYELFSPDGLLRGRVGKWAEQRYPVLRPYQILRAWASRQVQVASAPTAYVLEKHRKMGFFSQAKCMIIPNSHGLRMQDLDALRKQKDDGPRHPLRLFFLGRLVPEKGIETLCQAFTVCQDRFPQIILEVAGTGRIEGLLRERYRDQTNIRFHGAVYGEEKAKMLQECDALVMPSTCPEVFGLAAAEALAFGKPVLATKIGGIHEVITHGETGFLVPPENTEALSEAIRSIASQPECLLAMREACFAAAEKYASETILQQYLDFYHAADPA